MHERLLVDSVFAAEICNVPLAKSRNSKFYTRIFMEYFKRVRTTELDGLPWNEKQEVSEKVVGIIRNNVNEIMQINSQAKKLELFIRYLSVDALSDLVEKVSVVDVHNKNITYVLETILKKIEQQKTLTESCTNLLVSISNGIQKNIMKSFKSKGTNHIIRVLLRIKYNVEGLIDSIKKVPIEYILEDSTRTATFVEYLSYTSDEEKSKIVKHLLSILTVDHLKGYTSFLYEKVCKLSDDAQLDQIFLVIKPAVLELCRDEVGNYFMQTFISVYDPAKVYKILKPDIHGFNTNNNVVQTLLKRASDMGCTDILESAIKRLFTIDTIMHTLLFHKTGGFDSKSYKLAIKLMCAKTKYQNALQMQCVALYERYWLFNKVGQEIIISLLRYTNISSEVITLLTSTMTKEFIGIHESKGGSALLDAIYAVADRDTRRKIAMVRKRSHSCFE
ncbi:hypothetical protein NEPAR06_1561 [Nematocida parisii]|uniref:PUM-HD domain-containing protein n=1 Tax=Nematocida parisii (strain ERTm3) TaxID=935791 RepID=I3EH14_NEMP3|nr:uncharacterized protein NEPG_00285 [Nematocida parisii ERTm1]EIJ88511.1 hypothetical protein NEQG_01201 [Nematocida parisii ERTm3]EIJ94761.1 hypothetical protein NEPG_00285 [Nematocida parisii ERTm1]KAI5145254.1 hypothetical protein NEPAR07_1562 [Nematocida parisii]KAI5155122.1 hypothetical protein NEPAR06_1561 [Nematocida parisii]|eukprot:XP_013058117.1 hypothetical protein NEPG_00285 [Nematocida parisii ERTm1]